MSLIFREANLYQLPIPIQDTHTHVSLGDLHGNALKLIYVMIEEGVLELEASDGMSASLKYDTLRDIYYKPVTALTRPDLDLFENIIKNALVHKKKAVTLIGDELADRGKNDYFTLLVLKKLKGANVNIDIILSNHGVEFIRDYEKTSFTGNAMLGQGQAQSLSNLRVLIDKGLITEEAVREIVDQCYKPMVKAISYTMSQGGDVTLFSHAPIGLETVKSLANKFHILYQDSSPKELIHTIQAINQAIEKQFAEKGLAACIDQEGYTPAYQPVPPATHPLHRLIWNRALGDELIIDPTGAFKVKFVHGHTGDAQILKNGWQSLLSHQNIDSTFAKPGCNKTGYNATYQLNIQHFTRQSSELTANELTDEKLNEISNKWVKRHAQQKLLLLARDFVTNQIEFSQLLTELGKKTRELVAKGAQNNARYNPKYEEAARYAYTLNTTLTGAGDTFFSNEITQDSYDNFKDICITAIHQAEGEFSKHRSSWAALNPILKGLLGVVALMAIFPALIVSYQSTQGYFQTFFGAPATDSALKLQAFKAAVDQTLFQTIGRQVTRKTELELCKATAEQELNLMEEYRLSAASSM